MTASAKGYSSGTATLVIDIEKDFSKLLKFKDPLYIADYPQSGTGDIPLDKLDFDNVDSGTPVEITLKGRYGVKKSMSFYSDKIFSRLRREF